MEICQLSPVYCHDLKQYHHALKQRNALLKELQKGEGSPLDTLSVWDEQLCNYGRRVMEARKTFVERAGTLASETHAHMTGGGEKLSLQYLPNIKDAEIFKTTLEKNRQRDIALGSTAAGAHKDDIKFLINENDARVYGSQGQQRTAALSAKLAGIEIIKENTGTPPVLLLDDVLSELDGNRQAFLLSRIEGTQTLLTCTGMEDILKRSEAKIMKMVNGTIQ
jgi:DNA replication and repair protein RecF